MTRQIQPIHELMETWKYVSMLTAFTTKDAMQCSSKEVAHTTKCNLAVDKSACMIFCQKQYVRGFEGSRKVER